MVSSGALQLKRPCSDEGITLGTEHLGDSLEKILIVKPRGELEEKTQTSLLCPSADTVRVDVSLKVPDNLIEGSEHAHITVLGDIMGNTISNVGSFLRIPFGCGEQNLVIFAPNIYILQYLKSSHQLTPVVQETAIIYLTTGYQRQLMFKHDNGSYSAFGKKDKEGNTWLTAFTMRSFNMGQEFIYIDEKHILDAARYLKSLQQPNGCFQSVGKLFNNKLKSEVDDEVTLASYIAISFLEHNTVYHDVVDKTLDCLRDSLDKVNSTYSLVLLAYTFTLSGDLEQRKHVLDILEERAIKTDGSKHWELDSFGTGGTEMSAYVVLALLSKETTSHKDIEEASEIISWIIKQQNPFGGFSSTQDTVVALQALALYAKNTYSEKEDVKVTVRSLSGFQEQLHVDKSNSFLLQRVTLPDIPGEYTVTAVGSGCVYVQTHLKYHIPPPKSEIYFGLTVSTQPAVCTEESQAGFSILVETSYSGNRISSNMAMIEVDLLTGFFPDKKSVKRLEKNPNVRRTEVKPEKVIIYLEELSNEKETFSFSVIRDTPVRNLQPASVRVYDYYAPDEHAVAEYNAPCAPGSEIKESI
ncbi:alpha-2-macroglobulin-like [Discoglossus pictus]